MGPAARRAGRRTDRLVRAFRRPRVAGTGQAGPVRGADREASALAAGLRVCRWRDHCGAGRETGGHAASDRRAGHGARGGCWSTDGRVRPRRCIGDRGGFRGSRGGDFGRGGRALSNRADDILRPPAAGARRPRTDRGVGQIPYRDDPRVSVKAATRSVMRGRDLFAPHGGAQDPARLRPHPAPGRRNSARNRGRPGSPPETWRPVLDRRLGSSPRSPRRLRDVTDDQDLSISPERADQPHRMRRSDVRSA